MGTELWHAALNQVSGLLTVLCPHIGVHFSIRSACPTLSGSFLSLSPSGPWIRFIGRQGTPQRRPLRDAEETDQTLYPSPVVMTKDTYWYRKLGSISQTKIKWENSHWGTFSCIWFMLLHCHWWLKTDSAPLDGPAAGTWCVKGWNGPVVFCVGQVYLNRTLTHTTAESWLDHLAQSLHRHREHRRALEWINSAFTQAIQCRVSIASLHVSLWLLLFIGYTNFHWVPSNLADLWSGNYQLECCKTIPESRHKRFNFTCLDKATPSFLPGHRNHTNIRERHPQKTRRGFRWVFVPHTHTPQIFYLYFVN